MENEVQMLLFSLPQVPLMSISYLEEKPGSQLGIGNLEMDDGHILNFGKKVSSFEIQVG